MLILWVIIAVLWFLVVAEIQDGQHNTKVEDWPKLSGIQFGLQVSMLTLRVIIAKFVMSVNDWNPRWLTRWCLVNYSHKWSPPPKIQFWVFPSFLSSTLPPPQMFVSTFMYSIGAFWPFCTELKKVPIKFYKNLKHSCETQIRLLR